MASDDPEYSDEPSTEASQPPKPSGAKDTKSDSALIQVEAKATAGDLLGFGKAANTKAGEAVAKGIAPALGQVLSSAGQWLFGNRNAQAAALQRIADAQANAAVRLIDAEADQQVRLITERPAIAISVERPGEIVEADAVEVLRIAAGERVIADEVRRQETIEAAVEEAIKIADAADEQGEPGDVSQEFAIKWVNGVKDTSAPNVRSIYARLLASQVSPTPNRVSAPSFALLGYLDKDLAIEFERFVCRERVYVHIPYVNRYLPSLNEKNMELLFEAGFLVNRYVNLYYMGHITVNNRGYNYNLNELPIVTLSSRAQELVGAIYGQGNLGSILDKNPIPEDELANDILSTISLLMDDRDPRVWCSIFATDGAQYRFTCMKKNSGLGAVLRHKQSITLTSDDAISLITVALDKTGIFILRRLAKTYDIEFALASEAATS